LEWWGFSWRSGCDAVEEREQPLAGVGKEPTLMTQEQKVIRAKVGVLELAKQLGNVSRLTLNVESRSRSGQTPHGASHLGGSEVTARVALQPTKGPTRWLTMAAHC